MEDLTHRCMYDSLTRSGFCDSSTVPNFPSGGGASAWWKSQKHFCTDIEICLFCSFGLSILIVRAGFASNICETETKTIGTRVFIIPGLHENVTTPLIKFLHMVRTVPAVLLLTESQVFFWGKAGSTGQKSFPLIELFFHEKRWMNGHPVRCGVFDFHVKIMTIAGQGGFSLSSNSRRGARNLPPDTLPTPSARDAATSARARAPERPPRRSPPRGCLPCPEKEPGAPNERMKRDSIFE